MKQNPDLQPLNSDRVRVVLREALVPASDMFFGPFEDGRDKLGFYCLLLNPMQDGVPALIETRAYFATGRLRRQRRFDTHNGGIGALILFRFSSLYLFTRFPWRPNLGERGILPVDPCCG